MTTVATMKKVHTKAHEWNQPNEPVADEDVRPMLGDEEESCHSEKADKRRTDCRPPEGQRSGMFVVVHELSNPAVAKTTRINTAAFKSEYVFAVF